MREIRFYDKQLLPIPISDEQFDKLRHLYGRGGVIDINGNLVDTKAIEGIFSTEFIRDERARHGSKTAHNSLPASRLGAIIGQPARNSTEDGIAKAREYVRQKVSEAKERKSPTNRKEATE